MKCPAKSDEFEFVPIVAEWLIQRLVSNASSTSLTRTWGCHCAREVLASTNTASGDDYGPTRNCRGHRARPCNPQLRASPY
jgi:hypothetical protein